MFGLTTTRSAWASMLVALGLCTLPSLSSAQTPAPAEAKPVPVVLKGFGSWSMLSQFKDYEAPFWGKAVEQQTQGRIKTEYSAFDQSNLKGPEVLRLLKLGTLDFGTTVLSYISADDPITEAVDLAGALTSVGMARQAADSFRGPLGDYLDKKYDLRLLALYPYPAQMLFCKAPITNLDSLKGKKVRVSLRTTSDLIEAYGATTVQIPFNEVYGKLQSGAIDCLITGTLPAHTAKFYEVASHLYVLPLGWSMMMLGISNAAWEKISPQDRATITAGTNQLADQVWKAANDQTEVGLACNSGRADCALPNKGAMKLVQATDADRARLREIVKNVVVKRWAERCGKQCEDQWNTTVGKVTGIATR